MHNRHHQQAPNNRSQTPPTTFEQWTEESLTGLKNIELKAILADLGLKKSGNKDVLDDRILGREVVDVATTKKQEESLKGLKNIELKAILADLGLKKSGNKNVLVDRILGREKLF